MFCVCDNFYNAYSHGNPVEVRLFEKREDAVIEMNQRKERYATEYSDYCYEEGTSGEDYYVFNSDLEERGFFAIRLLELTQEEADYYRSEFIKERDMDGGLIL